MKKTAFIFSLIALFIIAGCTTNNDSSGTTVRQEDPFIGGTEGVIISFEEQAPPEEVFDGGDFPFEVVVKLKNEGEFAVPKENMLVTISGILATEFNKQEADLKQNPLEDLRANRKDSEGGIDESEPVFVEFFDFNHVEELTGNTPFRVRADVCYGYGTTANSRICVLEDNLDRNDDVCTVNEDKEVFSSGAPVVVEEFKESARAKNKIAFSFKVVHKGNGLIFQKDTQCDTSSRKFEDKVWVEVNSGLAGLECSGLREGTATSGFVTIFGNEKPVTCTQTVDTASDFEKPVVIELSYDYKENKETTILVKHSLS